MEVLFEHSIPILLVLPLLLLLLPLRKKIHKNENMIYIVSILIVILILLNSNFIWVNPKLYSFIDQGALSFALFFLVMFTGALKRKSKGYIMLMQIRREMALLGFIFLIPHSVSRLSLALSGYNSTGLIAMVLIIPLVITSYPLIRKKMTLLTWRKIHKAAYIVYLMIYLHLGFSIVLSNGLSVSIASNSVLYHIGFGVYLVFKMIYRWIPNIRKKS